jgi:hypothetical protein
MGSTNKRAAKLTALKAQLDKLRCNLEESTEPCARLEILKLTIAAAAAAADAAPTSVEAAADTTAARTSTTGPTTGTPNVAAAPATKRFGRIPSCAAVQTLLQARRTTGGCRASTLYKFKANNKSSTTSKFFIQRRYHLAIITTSSTSTRVTG